MCLLCACHLINPLNIIFRIISYVFGAWVVCRIGGLLAFEPTYAHDNNQVIKNIFKEGQFTGVIGFIPELFEIILLAWDVLIEGIFIYLDVVLTK